MHVNTNSNVYSKILLTLHMLVLHNRAIFEDINMLNNTIIFKTNIC